MQSLRCLTLGAISFCTSVGVWHDWFFPFWDIFSQSSFPHLARLAFKDSVIALEDIDRICFECKDTLLKLTLKEIIPRPTEKLPTWDALGNQIGRYLQLRYLSIRRLQFVSYREDKHLTSQELHQFAHGVMRWAPGSNLEVEVHGEGTDLLNVIMWDRIDYAYPESFLGSCRFEC